MSFEVPEAYRDVVQRATLSILAPAAGNDVTCLDIAFRRASADQILAATVEEAVLQDGSSVSLQRVPREGLKILVARAFDSAGEEVAAGCSEQLEITDEHRITIEGEVSTFASIPDMSPLGEAGRAAVMQVVDAYGQPVEVEVQWQVTGPQLDEQGSAMTDANGMVTIEVEPPPLPGPVGVVANSKWARRDAPLVSGFREPQVLLAATLPDSQEPGLLRNAADVFQVGRIGPQGQLGFAAMGQPVGATGRQVVQYYFDQNSSQFVETVSERLPNAAIVLGILPGTGRDRIVSSTLTSIIEVLPDGTLQSVPVGGGIPPLQRALPLGGCDGEAGSLLVVAIGGQSYVFSEDSVPSASEFASPNAPGVPIASGCVQTPGGGLRRAVVYKDSEEDTSVYVRAEIDGVVRQGKLTAVPAGIGFSPEGGADDAYLLATLFGIEGTEISRRALLPTGETELDFPIVKSDPTPTFAQATSAGDFDGDGLVDIAATQVVDENADETRYRLFTALGLEGPLGRVVGVSAVYVGRRPTLFVADFNGDGHDDVLSASTNSFELFSFGAPAP